MLKVYETLPETVRESQERCKGAVEFESFQNLFTSECNTHFQSMPRCEDKT
jgi:hypothetical protein